MLPFWISIAILSLVQGLLVALPRAAPAPHGAVWPARALAGIRGLRGRAWAVAPPLSVLVFVLVAGAAAHQSAQALTYLALVAVPLLALLALGWLAGPRLWWAWLALPALFALAWADRGGLAGEAGALVLTSLSCVALGMLLAAVTPRRWLSAGLVAMALADSALVISDLLQRPNNALNAAHPAAGLPRLQSAAFGSAVMGYGDLFAAATLGALLASAAGRTLQRRGAALTALIALAMDLLFFAVNELPATVPVALTLLALAAGRRFGSGLRARARGAPAPARPLRPAGAGGAAAPEPARRLAGGRPEAAP